MWYALFVSTLQDFGFKLNPYDECVANKIINGQKYTNFWHVDDNKILNVDKNVVIEVIESIKAKFGKMIVTCGKTHVF